MVTFGIPEALPLKYAGPEAATIPLIAMKRRPTVNDKKYPVGQFAILKQDPLTGTQGELWYLAYFDTSGNAIWDLVSTTIDTTMLIQQIRESTNSLITCDGITPFDDTIPQQTEGTEVITTTITPTSITSKLTIEFDAWIGTPNPSAYYSAALFKDSDLDSIQSAAVVWNQVGVWASPISLKYTMTSGTISPITFKIRIGTNDATRPCLVNGCLNLSTGVASRIYGGTSNANLVITEYTT